jgi:hypothetical protein
MNQEKGNVTLTYLLNFRIARFRIPISKITGMEIIMLLIQNDKGFERLHETDNPIATTNEASR